MASHFNGCQGINTFDAILYINLEHRKDRKESILAGLGVAGAESDKIVRIDAHLDPFNGHRGCTISHIKALNYAIENGLNNVLILEDDFAFIEPLEVINAYIDDFFVHFKNEWDVFFLSAKVKSFESSSHPTIARVLCARSGHSYAVNAHYLNRLRSCFEFALERMKNDHFFFDTDNCLHAFDHLWHVLMPIDRWYIGPKFIGTQIYSYSDISHVEGLYDFPHFL